MSRLSIEITSEQHQKIKAVAALNGSSIRDYVLERVLPTTNEEDTISELEAFLQPRIEAARNGKVISSTAKRIFNATL